MNLEQYISDLLYRYNCVILPEFGGFICNNANAEIDVETNVLSPPYKSISFNVNLKNNDGLLVNYIADVEQISYEQTLHMVFIEIKKWQEILETQKTLKLGRVGVLNIDTKHKITFSPNHSLNRQTRSFGMGNIVYKPIQRQNTVKKIENVENVENVMFSKIHTVNNESSFSFTTFFRYAAIIVLFICFGGIFFLENYEKDQFKDYASFIPISDIENSIKTKTLGKNIKTNTKDIITFKELQIDSKVAYRIVLGVFKYKKNALKVYKKLNSKGYVVKVYFEKGMYKIYTKFNHSEKEVKRLLKKVRVFVKDAWIFKETVQ